MRAPCKPEEFFCVMIAPSSSPSSKPAASGASIPSNYLKDVLTQIPPLHQQDCRPTHPAKLAHKPPVSRGPCRLIVDVVDRVYDTYDSFTGAL